MADAASSSPSSSAGPSQPTKSHPGRKSPPSQKAAQSSTSGMSSRPKPTEPEPTGCEPTGSASDSDSDSDFGEVSQEYMEELLRKAKENAALQKQLAEANKQSGLGEEETIMLPVEEEEEEEEDSKKLPDLTPSSLPEPYMTYDTDPKDGWVRPPAVRDIEAEKVKKATENVVTPAPAHPVKQKLSKKEKEKLKNKTTGPAWYDLPAPDPADLPRLHREVEALRLHAQMDPKRFYKKDDGEGKGIKGLPKHFAIGTILPTPTPFAGTSGSDNLARAQRKRTLVDELVDDAEAARYAKQKFNALQGVRGAKGKGTLAKRKEARRAKW